MAVVTVMMLRNASVVMISRVIVTEGKLVA